MLKLFGTALLGVVMLLGVGCKSQNDNGTTMSSSAVRSPSAAVVCDECKTTWVQTPVLNDKGRPVPYEYRTTSAPVCSECEQAAKGYFDTGKTPTCQMCGGSLHVVQPQKM
jgi:hypothetical protein